jgi:hypothetical protein
MPDPAIYCDLFVDLNNRLRSPDPAVRDKAERDYEHMARRGRVSGPALVERAPNTAALACLRHSRGLNAWEIGFLSSMVHVRAPSERQVETLAAICARGSAETVGASKARRGRRVAP